MQLKLNTQTDTLVKKQKLLNRKSQNMASSLVNDDEDNASSTTATTTTTRNTQQQLQTQQQQQINNNNNTNCLNQQNSNNNTATNSSANSSTGTSKMHGNESKVKKENLQQRKLELEKLLNEKNWLLQQLQQQESEILNGNFEYMNFNDFLQNLAVQYKQEQSVETGSSSTVGGVSQFSAGEEAILRRKPLTAKENQQHHNVLHRRQSEISNRSSEYDNYPHQDNLSTHSEGANSRGEERRGGVGSGGGTMTMQHAQAQQQYNAKSALKKRSATVAGTTQQSATNLQMIRQHHLDQQLIQQHQQQVQHQQQQQQQQHLLYKQQHYHHPQQHLFKQHLEHHQVLMPHLQYATQKFYYTTLQPTQPAAAAAAAAAAVSHNPQPQRQQPQPQQQQYGRYIKAQPQQQSQAQLEAQQHHHLPQNTQQQSPNHMQSQQPNHYASPITSNTPTSHHHQQPLLLTPPHGGGASAHIDNISLYSLNSNNVATLHRQAQQQQPIIVQCDKYYLSPTTHHVSHNDGGGFIKSSQNIKEYISPMNSPQQLMTAATREKRLASQTNLSQRGITNTPSIDAISLAPSYMSMETVDYISNSTSQQHHQNPYKWRSQTNLPPHNNNNNTTATSSSSSSANLVMGLNSNEMKSYSSDMLNNNQYYNTSINPPPPPSLMNNNTLPPNVTQVKPFKPLDEISINSYSSETQKKTKPKQWLESSLDGPVIRQTQTHQMEESNAADYSNSNSTMQQRSKLSSHSLNTSRHYSMSAAQAKPLTSTMSSNSQTNKLSQSTSYLNQMEAAANSAATTPPSISQAYNVETTSPQTPMAYKFLPVSNNQKPPARPPLYINAGSTTSCASPTTGLLSGVASSSSALSPDIRVESPKNVTVVQPATFQPYKEVTKPFEMSDFYKYSTKYRQKENNSATQPTDN